MTTGQLAWPQQSRSATHPLQRWLSRGFLSVLTIVVLLGVMAGGYYATLAPVTIIVDGQARTVKTNQRSVENILREAGIKLEEGDIVGPAVTASLADDATATALDRAAERDLLLPARFAVLANACRSPRAAADFLGKLRVQQEAAQLARLLVELREPLATSTSSAAIVDVLERGDAFRRPERFELLLQAFEACRELTAKRFRVALKAATAVDAGALAALHRNDPAEIPRAVRQARVVAVGRALYGDDALEQPRQ